MYGFINHKTTVIESDHPRGHMVDVVDDTDSPGDLKDETY